MNIKSFFSHLVVGCTFYSSLIAQVQQHANTIVKTAPNYLTGEEARAADLYQKVIPTVVNIFTFRNVITKEGLRVEESLGSGVFVTEECYILTAAHIVHNADVIIVKTYDGKKHDAELLFSEPLADIALIKLKIPDTQLPHAVLGNSDSLAVGQRTYIIGSPYGLENSFSVGRISAFREFDRLYDGTILAEFIQTDAAINSGNSGGPMFNSKGEVIGIASRIMSVSGGFQGLGFVIAINTAKQILAFEDHVWMGFDAIFLKKEQLALLFNLDADGGLLVQNVISGSPADKAGIKEGILPAQILNQTILLGGDLILEFGKQKVCHSQCLVEAGKYMKDIKKINVKLLREGQLIETVIDVSKSTKRVIK